MENKLNIIIEDTINNTVFLSKEIDFIPSKGLIIYEPIYGIIGNVVYNKDGYTADLEESLKPTNPYEQIEHLKSIGFKIIK